MATAPIEEVTEYANEPEAVEALPPVVEPAPAAAPAPVEVAKEIPAAAPELPKTASPYPLVGLTGLLSLFIFSVLRLVRTS